MTKQWQGSLALLAAVLIWGSAFIAQSVGMELIGPFTFQAIRCGLAVVFLAGVSLIRGGQGTQWREPRLWKAGVLCGLALFAAASLQQIGLMETDAGKAGFLTAMYIVLVPVLGLFLGRKPPRATVFSVILAVAGLYLLSCLGASGINPGDLCLMGCALAFAVQIRCVDAFGVGLDGVKLNCVQALVVTVLSLPFALLTETVDFGSIAACALPLGYAGILSMGVAYTLQIYGQQRLEPTAASLIMSLESVIAALCGWWLLGETMTAPELLGCGLVFGAVVLSQVGGEGNAECKMQNAE